MAYDPTKDPLNPANNDFSGVTPEGAIENQLEFRRSVSRAWMQTGNGTAKGVEAGFTADKSGKLSPVESQNGTGMPAGAMGHLKQQATDDTMLALHTHPNTAEAMPSENDRDIARRTGRQIYVQSREGLFQVDATGAVTKVFDGTGWMDAKPGRNSVYRDVYNARKGGH